MCLDIKLYKMHGIYIKINNKNCKLCYVKLFYILYKMWLKLAEHISSQNCVSDVRLYYKALNACLSTLIRKYTKIKIFNVCMKSVLLYGCETWLVTSEIRRKIQTFVNPWYTKEGCLRPQRVIFCDPAVTISTNLLPIFVCVPHQLKINIM